MRSLNELKERLLSQCKEDEVGLWAIIWYLRADFGMEDPKDIRHATLQIVRELLETGEVIAGWYAPPESGLPSWRIVPWPGDIDSILTRIAAEWDQLGHEPNIGDIVILQAKD